MPLLTPPWRIRNPAFDPVDVFSGDVVVWQSARARSSMLNTGDGTASDGQGVKSWANLITGSNALFAQLATATAAQEPNLDVDGLGGFPALSFPGGSVHELFAECSDAETSWTIVQVVDVLGEDNLHVDIETGRFQLHLDSTGAGDGPGWFDGAVKDVGATHVAGRQILTWKLAAGGNGEIFRGLTSLGTEAYTGTAFGATFMLGHRHNSTVAPRADMLLSEQVFVRGAMADAEIFTAVKLLAAKWGLAGSAGMDGGS